MPLVKQRYSPYMTSGNHTKAEKTVPLANILAILTNHLFITNLEIRTSYKIIKWILRKKTFHGMSFSSS